MVSQELDSPMRQEIVNKQFHDNFIMLGYREVGHIFSIYWN
jgi:hypothetical protein